MARCALLIANAVKYGLPDSGVPVGIVRSRVKDLAERLTNLGEASFDVTAIVNLPHGRALSVARRAIRSVGSDGLLLVYYFGHGVRGDNDELFFFGPGSDSNDLTTMLSMRDITRLVRLTRVPESVFLLDCCYGGTAELTIQTDLGSAAHSYLLAAASPREKAYYEQGIERPFGYFSQALLQAFQDKAAAELDGRVSPRTLGTYIRGTLPGWQTLHSRDSGLADLALFVQRRELRIPSGVNRWISHKTMYMKIHTLVELLSSRPFPNWRALYSIVQRRTPQAFLAPIKVDDRSLKYGVVGPETFRRYISLCELLGIVEQGETLQLSRTGKRMIRGNGRAFNPELFTLLKNAWERYGLRVEALQDVVVRRVQSGWVPTAAQLYSDIYSGRSVNMGRELFELLLSLTAYVGALQYSRERVFFVAST